MADSKNNSNDKNGLDAVPKAVVARLSLYLRELQQVFNSGKETISSRFLGQRLGITDAQVRKDFTYFGQFGYPGIGYRCEELIDEIKKILGTDKVWPVALIGCGNLGSALLGYRGFGKQGFEVVAAFDVAGELIGRKIGDLTIRHINQLPDWVEREQIFLAILAVPAAAANQALEVIVQSGISGILNFAPVTLSVPKHVQVVGVDLAIELEQLAFGVANFDPK
ncbi:MAG: redox-sensing transcriptional repressor Rex [Planctomycetota bacterium]